MNLSNEFSISGYNYSYFLIDRSFRCRKTVYSIPSSKSDSKSTKQYIQDCESYELQVTSYELTSYF